MPTLAILKSFSFKTFKTFAPHQPTGQIEYRNFNNTFDLLHAIQQVLGKSGEIEIMNLFYDKTHLTQGFYIDNNEQIHENIIVVKRLIHDNDSYTLLEFNPHDPSTDIYKYVTITEQDILDIVRRRSIISSLFLSQDNTIRPEEVIFLNQTSDVGKILLKSGPELTYLNVSNIVAAGQQMQPDELGRLIQEKTNAYSAEYSYTQKDLGFCILNCIYQTIGEAKNELMTKLFGEDMYGNAIVFIQSNTNNDSDTILHLDLFLFDRIVDIVTTGAKIRPKNKHFFNLYYELGA